jgi:hypothetical protein
MYRAGGSSDRNNLCHDLSVGTTGFADHLVAERRNTENDIYGVTAINRVPFIQHKIR